MSKGFGGERNIRDARLHNVTLTKPDHMSGGVPFARPGVAYTLRNALYLSLTNECNATPLTRTRGPGFTMPSHSGFVQLSGAEPTANELARVVDAFYARDDLTIASSGESDPGVVFAGYGEPLLRAERLCEAVREIRELRHGVALRANTNGLVDAKVAGMLADAGVRAITVALNASNPEEYERVMAPVGGRGFTDVLEFIQAAVEAGIEVEGTCVRTPGVDTAATRRLAMALGCVDFREREYFK